MDNIEELEGCMCQYIPEHLRVQLEAVAEKTDSHTCQVVQIAIQLGLAVIIGKSGVLLQTVSSSATHGKINPHRKGKLSGVGASN